MAETGYHLTVNANPAPFDGSSYLPARANAGLYQNL
jgi:hypothetical protein